MEGKVKIKKVNKTRLAALLLSGFVLTSVATVSVGCSKQPSDNEIVYEDSIQEELTETDLIAINYLQEYKNRVDFITQNEYDSVYLGGPEEETRVILSKIGFFVFYKEEVDGINFYDLSDRGKKEAVEMVKEMYEILSDNNYVTEGDPSFDDDGDEYESYVFFKYIDELLFQSIGALDKSKQEFYESNDVEPVMMKLYYLEKMESIIASDQINNNSIKRK